MKEIRNHTRRPPGGLRGICSLAALFCLAFFGTPAAPRAFAQDLTNEPASAGNGFDQSPPGELIEVWDTDTGLPHSTVTSIAQTPDGYLWVGTLFGGLARFDGVHFEDFNPGNTPQLKSIEIERLLVDARGTLWIGTVDGSITSFRNGVFTLERQGHKTPPDWLWSYVGMRAKETLLSTEDGSLLRFGTTDDGKSYCKVVDVPHKAAGSQYCMDHDGVVWLRTVTGSLEWMRTNTFEPAPAAGLTGQRVVRLLRDDKGRVWVGTDKEIALWNGKEFRDMTPTNGPPVVSVVDMAFSGDGGLWIRTATQLRKCVNRQWVAEASPWNGKFRPSPRPVTMHGDAEGGVWLAHYGDGLWHVDAKGRTERISEAQGLPGGLVGCWYQDREHDVWVGMAGGGLVRLRHRDFQVLWPPEYVHDRAACSVCEDAAGSIWVGVSQGTLFRWNHAGFTTYKIPAEPNLGRDVTVCPDSTGQLWVGTVQNGVWLLKDGVLQRAFPLGSVGTVARVLFGDREGRMWIGNEFGLFVWADGHLHKFGQKDGFGQAHSSQGNGFEPAYVMSITEDKTGAIWMGTAQGELRRYQDGKFTTYRTDDNFGPVRIWSLLADNDGTIWAGTLGGGLLRLRNGKFTRYLVKDGLPDDNISELLDDDRGQLWVGSRGGIFRVLKSELNDFAAGKISEVSCHVYDKYDGLPTKECASGFQPACWHGRDGRLWFAMAKGVVSVQPDKITSNPLPPPVVIQKVLVDGKRIGVPGQATFAAVPSSLQVKPGRHYFEFYFAGLSFVAPDKVRFKWRLKGLDRRWVAGGTRRMASYSYVPPGQYEFQVQACNDDGVWNTTGASMKLTVLPYFWQTWWFKVAIAGLICLILATVYSIRVARLQQMARLRLRIARDLHDEVGANLGSISLLAQVMEKQPSPSDASLVRQIAVQTIDTLRDVVWFIDPTHERLSDLVSRLRETAANMLREVPHEFIESGKFGSTELPLVFRRNVPPLFKEALNNVLKHARATSVRIHVSRVEDRFQFIVADNGVGIREPLTGSGNGLKNMRRRASEMGGELEIKRGPSGGTTVAFSARIT